MPKKHDFYINDKYGLETDYELCLQLVIWHAQELNETVAGSGIYKALPPTPDEGHWMGYYVELFFEGDT